MSFFLKLSISLLCFLGLFFLVEKIVDSFKIFYKTDIILAYSVWAIVPVSFVIVAFVMFFVWFREHN